MTPITLGPDTALVLVDMQNSFCHPRGGAGAIGLDLSLPARAVPNVMRLAKACHRAGIAVMWSRQEHLEDDVGRLAHRIPTHVQKEGYLPAVRGTWDSEILDELKPFVGPDDVVFTKHRASCFFNTTLELNLRMRGVHTLIIAGVATNYCVDATIRDAYARDYDLLIVEDACGSSQPELHEAAMRNNALFHGAVVSTEEVIELLEPLASASVPTGA